MSELEKIALNQLKRELNGIAQRVTEANEKRIEHEIGFVRSAVDRAIEIVKAIESHT